MTIDQGLTLLILVAVIAMLIWDRLRADVVALSGAAILLMTGVVRPVDVQGAFASPAIIALASLFVIAYGLELSGLLDRAISLGVRSEEHTSELQSLMRISYAVFCLKKKNTITTKRNYTKYTTY